MAKSMDEFEDRFWSGQSLDELYRGLVNKTNDGFAALFIAAMTDGPLIRTREAIASAIAIAEQDACGVVRVAAAALKPAAPRDRDAIDAVQVTHQRRTIMLGHIQCSGSKRRGRAL